MPDPILHENQPSSPSPLVPEKPTDTILKTCTYNREREISVCKILCPNPLQAKVAAASLSAVSRDFPSTLGFFGDLPLPLVYQILLDLDIASIFALRKTNVYAWQLLNGLHEYRIMLQHAYGTFCALLRTRCALHVSLQDFYRLLCSKKCTSCGVRYGNRVHLARWQRLCDECGDSQRQYSDTKSVKRVLCLSRNSMGHISSFDPGSHFHRVQLRCPTTNAKVVCTVRAIEQYHFQHHDAAPTDGMFQKLIRASTKYSPAWYLPSYDAATDQVEHGVSCAGCAFDKYNVKGPMGGYRCNAPCTVYSADEFLEHFEACTDAQKLWSASKHGRVKPWNIIHGYYFCSLSASTRLVQNLGGCTYTPCRCHRHNSEYRVLA